MRPVGGPTSPRSCRSDLDHAATLPCAGMKVSAASVGSKHVAGGEPAARVSVLRQARRTTAWNRRLASGGLSNLCAPETVLPPVPRASCGRCDEGHIRAARKKPVGIDQPRRQRNARRSCADGIFAVNTASGRTLVRDWNALELRCHRRTERRARPEHTLRCSTISRPKFTDLGRGSS
jgi:hypothetical protein